MKKKSGKEPGGTTDQSNASNFYEWIEGRRNQERERLANIQRNMRQRNLDFAQRMSELQRERREIIDRMIQEREDTERYFVDNLRTLSIERGQNEFSSNRVPLTMSHQEIGKILG